NRGIGDYRRNRIWGEGRVSTGRGMGDRSENGNGVSEMFGHDGSIPHRFPVYANQTSLTREDSFSSFSPSHNQDERPKHDQSAQSNPQPNQNRNAERPQYQGVENTLKLL